MSGLEDRLSLDISDALNAISQIEDAFVQAGRALQDSLEQAVSSLGVIDPTIEFQADTDAITPEIDAAIEAANDVIPLEADAEGITTSIDEAVSAADAQVAVSADTTEAQNALDSLSDVQVAIDVDTSGIEQAASALEDLGAAGEAAGSGGEKASAGIGSAGAAAAIAGGEFSRAGGLLEGFGAGGAAAAGALAILGVAGKTFFDAGLESRAATERFNLSLGEFAQNVNQVDVGGLNEDLQTLGVRLGSDDEALQNTAATIFTLGKNSGIAAPEVAKTTEQVLALAARAVALNPALGDVGDVAQRLFTGLARGGRFAANFGLSLSTAEITARGLANTGKSAASDLTLFEKSMAGAQLASEKLGDSLATDINAGADNIQFKFRAIRGEFKETLDTLGEPLLDPLLSAAEAAQPALEDLAQVFGEILIGLVPLADNILNGLTPALDGLVPLAQGIGAALGVIADVIDAIPGPVAQAAVSFIALNVALKAASEAKILTTLASRIPALATGIGNLGALAVPAAAALTATGLALQFLRHEAAETDTEVSNFLDDIVQKVNTAPTIAALEDVIAQTKANAEAQRDAAEANDTFVGSITRAGETRGFEEVATGEESIVAAGNRVVSQAILLQREFGLTETAALALARSGQANVDAFRAQAGAAEEFTAQGLAAARATEDFWLEAQTGSLTAEEIQERAAATGATFEDLADAVSKAREPIVEFAQSIIDSLPGAADALTALGENEGLDKFVQNLEDNVRNAAAFVGNLQTLIDQGATDLANLLASLSSTDPEKAAKLAAEAVAKGPEELLKLEGKIDATNFGQNLVNTATQNVANQLGGGLELAANTAREQFGEALMNIPGQLGEETTSVGSQIATDVSDALLIQTGKIDFRDPFRQAGAEVAIGFAEGIQSQETEIAFAAVHLAKVVSDSVSGFLQISSPSKLFQELGELTAQGFIIGISDLKGLEDVVDPLLDVVDKFKLSADDIARATGDSVDSIVADLTKLGEAQKAITPDELLKVGEAVKALGGTKGVGELQKAIAQQVSAAFGGMSAKEISEVVSKINTKSAVARVQSIIGVTPTVPTPFETNVIKGSDPTSGTVELNVTVTPPPDVTAEEQAFLVARAVGWNLQGVQ